MEAREICYLHAPPFGGGSRWKEDGRQSGCGGGRICGSQWESSSPEEGVVLEVDPQEGGELAKHGCHGCGARRGQRHGVGTSEIAQGVEVGER